MSSSSNDELAEINGVKPKVTLKDGEEREVKSLTRFVVPIKQAPKVVTLILEQLFRVQGQAHLGSLLLVCTAVFESTRMLMLVTVHALYVYPTSLFPTRTDRIRHGETKAGFRSTRALANTSRSSSARPTRSHVSS